MKNKILTISVAIVVILTLVECQYYRNPQLNRNKTIFRRVPNCTIVRNWRCVARTPALHRPGWKPPPNQNFNHKKYPYTHFGSSGIRRNYRERLNGNHQLVQRLNKLPSKWPARNSTHMRRKFHYGFQQYNRNSTHISRFQEKAVTKKTPVVYWNKHAMNRRVQSHTTTSRPYTWYNARKTYYQKVPFTKIPARYMTHATVKKNRDSEDDEQDLMFATKAPINTVKTITPMRKYNYVRPVRPIRPNIDTKYHSSGSHNQQTATGINRNPQQSSHLRFDKRTGIALGRKSNYHPSVHNQQQHNYAARNSTANRWHGSALIHH